MRMVSSPGKSIRRRREICPGLHALAHRRGCRRPGRRPFPATAGPPTAAPPGVATAPDRRSCTYVRRAAVVASLALFGRRAARSACHCAVEARYSKPPLRVAALRRNSREIVDAARPIRRATSCTVQPCALRSAISSRSANERYLPDCGFADGPNIAGRIPPAFLNHPPPTAGGTLALAAPSPPARPDAIPPKNLPSSWPPATDGRPGEGNGALPERSDRLFHLVIAALLRRRCDNHLNLPWLPLSLWCTSPLRWTGRRSWRACSSASSTKPVCAERDTRQPTMRRA